MSVTIARTVAERTTCLQPVWDDGIYRVRCAMGAEGVCARHGRHQPHPEDERSCDPASDGYCRTHGVYIAPGSAARPAGGES